MAPLRSFCGTALCFATLAAGGCDANPSNPPVGAFEITTTSPALASDLTTSDGWSVKWSRFLVHVTSVTVAGDDLVVSAAASPQIIDQVSQTPKSLLAATVRTARPWQDVDLEIGPASADNQASVVDPVTEDDRTNMETGGLSYFIEATLTKGDVTKTLTLGLTSDTDHGQCQDGVIRGLVVSPNATESVSIAMDGAVLFADDLDTSTTLRAAAIADADADADGKVTMTELHAVALADPYKVGANTAVGDLGAFIEALSRKTVRSFQANGTCTPQLAGADATAAAAASSTTGAPYAP